MNRDRINSSRGDHNIKNGSFRKMQRVRRRRRRLVILMLLALLIPAGAALLYLNLFPVFLKSRVVVKEITEQFDAFDNIRFVFGGSAEQVKVETEADLTKPGDYPILYTYGKRQVSAVLQVRDLTPPELSVHSYTTDEVEEVKPEQFVEKAEDISKVTLSFADPEIRKNAGTWKIRITAEDESGNRTEKETELIRVKDEKGPRISGTEDRARVPGERFGAKEAVSVEDDMDPVPLLEVDDSNLDLSVPGTYYVDYRAKDRSGNQTEVRRKIVVKKKEEKEEKVVYLTFDDGPSANTEKVLDILKKENVKATFFVTGNNPKYNYLMKRAREEGHAIGLHTYTHDYSRVYSSEKAFFDDLQKISDLVEKTTGERSKLLRFPGGSSNLVSAKYTKGIMSSLTKKVREKGYQYFDWNCDSTDAAGNNVPVETLVKNASSGQGKQINILMHDTDAKDTTVAALPKIIESYRNRGYTFRELTADSFAPQHKVNN